MTALTEACAIVAVFSPLLAFGLLAALYSFWRKLPERILGFIVGGVFSVGFLASSGVAIGLALADRPAITVDLGAWFRAGEYAFHWSLLIDRLSVPFLLFTAVLCGTVGAFATRYLHREPGHARFMLLLLLFGAGINLLTMAGSLDLAFAGWEVVGLTSVLLISFFHERKNPIDHSLWTYGVYRVTDIGLLFAAISAHHFAGSSDYVDLYGAAPWPGGTAPLSAGAATVVGLGLAFAIAGKSALVPFSGWLPRAMEGPTPSSAIFYGALSVHAGAYVLLRAAPVLDRSPTASWVLVVVGLTTALHATFVGRTQSDIKSALAYASMTQVGLIVTEIGLGLRMLALIHVVAHACLRSLQFLRAPSLLHEHHATEAAVGGHLARTGLHYERAVPRSLQRWLYRLALERGYHDAILRHLVVDPVLKVLERIDSWEQRWVDLLSGRAPEPTPPGSVGPLRTKRG
jgi:NAD(P)H-quinone oxidoreductase subunit 5